ncbi:MAG: tetratricopeptide repeat protein [Acidobacteriota bacterium]
MLRTHRMGQKTVPVALCSLAVCLQLVVEHRVQASSYEEHLRLARRFLAAHRPSDALEPLSRALSERPEAGDVLWMMAVAHLELGRYKQGMPYAERLTRAAPGEPQSHLLLAAFFEALDEEQRAIEEYRAVLRLDPDNCEGLYRLGRLSMGRGDDETAIRAFEQIAKGQPGELRALLPLGVLYARNERLREALDTLKRALALDGNSYEVHHYLGVTYGKLSQWEIAFRHLDRALEINPRHVPSIHEKAMLYSQRDELSTALELFLIALEAAPDDPMLHFGIGEIYAYQNAPGKAEKEFQEALRINPKLHPAYHHYGRLLLRAGRYEEAVEKLTRAVELDPRHAESHDQLAQAHEALHQTEKARQHYHQAIELDPLLANAFLHYGNFLMRRGDRREGQELLRQFHELRAVEEKTRRLKAEVGFHPDDVQAKEKLSEHLIANQRYEEALRNAREFLASDPQVAEHYFLLGRAYLAMDRFMEAIRVLKEGLQLAPSSAEAHRNLGRAYIGAGQRLEGERELALAEKLASQTQKDGGVQGIRAGRRVSFPLPIGGRPARRQPEHESA